MTSRPTLWMAALVLAAGLSPAPAQEPAPAPQPTIVSPPNAAAAPGAEPLDPSLSPECRVPGSKLYTLAKLRAVKMALKDKRPVRVLAVGSTSAGPGASATYPMKLETALERSLPDVDVVVEARGLQGEIASGAAERLRSMVADVEPDLVIWQVGTHDALARVEIDAFGEALDETVKWIKSHEMDVVLVDPLYTASLADDAYYSSIVRKVQEVAAREGVPLVQRYEAMRYLSGRAEKSEGHMLGRQFRLNDLGLRCMAEHVTRAITLSLLQPDTTGTAGPVLKSDLPAAVRDPNGPQVNPTPDGH
ncbi:SGNH/GDSL hydrolase family protein [Methylobacterium planeticum]|uniref:SGNH/GDSL hydrolase family protein n=2 Tax=Methylobacterium planeticum TaxID=2615211 RepID=A0A6N6MR77_9HYPH|nr:GDSL-type esterase/lipase family protein [Methylobacterium planeticum]KAB1072638.1 SGNH/GDSL hydrolase family protein [Methylobacterium planeticum]